MIAKVARYRETGKPIGRYLLAEVVNVGEGAGRSYVGKLAGVERWYDRDELIDGVLGLARLPSGAFCSREEAATRLTESSAGDGRGPESGATASTQIRAVREDAPVHETLKPIDPVAEAIAIARSANIESLDQIDWTKPARTEREARIRAALLAEARKTCAKSILPLFRLSHVFGKIGIGGPNGSELWGVDRCNGDLPYLADDARSAIREAYLEGKAYEAAEKERKRQDTLERAIDAAEGRTIESDDEPRGDGR